MRACSHDVNQGFAQSNRSAASQGLEGTWIVQVTLRNCATNASIGTFNSLVTFHAAARSAKTTSRPAFAIGQRSSGHGNWDFDGRRSFSQRMVALINFDTAANLPGTPGFNPSLPVTPGFFAGYSVVTHSLELTDANHGTSSGTNEFFRPMARRIEPAARRRRRHGSNSFESISDE